MEIAMRFLLALSLIVSVCSVQAAVQEKKVEYKYEDNNMTGYLYWDDAIEGKRPGVLLVHEWWGLNDYARKRAHMLAELGYVAFAVDMYGNGHVTDKPAQAKEWMQEVTADVEGWRERALLGIEQLNNSGLVDGDKLAAIGYCFGGATVFHLAYANAPIKGVASFHGALPAAPAESKGKIGPKIMIFHGDADSFVAPEVVDNFRSKLAEAGADAEMITYVGARHGFTNPDAGSFGIENLQYDEAADKHSWQKMQEFFKDIF
jgi:dienelactone hydrolase